MASSSYKLKINPMTEPPKKPPTAYLLWIQEVRDQIKTDNPDVPKKEISKLAGQIWKDTDEKDTVKAKYLKIAEKLKAEYHKEMEKHGPKPKKSKATTSKRKNEEAAAPKNPAKKAKKAAPPPPSPNEVSEESN